MANIELVIKIPEEDYKFLREAEGCRFSKTIIDGVINGTPLPKGHGRLIDENNLWFEDIDDISCVTQRNVENAPTIIEAESKGNKND